MYFSCSVLRFCTRSTYLKQRPDLKSISYDPSLLVTCNIRQKIHHLKTYLNSNMLISELEAHF